MPSKPAADTDGLVQLDDEAIDEVRRRALAEAREREERDRLKREHPAG